MFDVSQIQEILPHRYPILLVDRVTAMAENESLDAYKNITITESVFQGHFPGHPIYPGVFIVEGLAQAGGILAYVSMFGQDARNSDKVVYFMGIDGCKFRQPVRPGDVLEYKLAVIKQRGNIWVMRGEAFVDGKLATEAELKAMITDKDK